MRLSNQGRCQKQAEEGIPFFVLPSYCSLVTLQSNTLLYLPVSYFASSTVIMNYIPLRNLFLSWDQSATKKDFVHFNLSGTCWLIPAKKQVSQRDIIQDNGRRSKAGNSIFTVAKTTDQKAVPPHWACLCTCGPEYQINRHVICLSENQK